MCSMCGYLLDDNMECPECEICNGDIMKDLTDTLTVGTETTFVHDDDVVDHQYTMDAATIDNIQEEAVANAFKYAEDNNFDPVDNPLHYTIRGGIECIDYIEQMLGPKGFAFWCWGNVIKYQHRHEYKGKPIQDMKKAQFYLNKWIETREALRK